MYRSAPQPLDYQSETMSPFTFEMSTVLSQRVLNLQAPMMFMLGAKDRRVPLADGLQYISALRAQAATDPSLQAPRVITFAEDTHSLEKPQTEFEQWLNTAWWLKMYLK
jgi:dipeptidyl aminopeptidase/acylaminoacyl peptidase